MARRRPHTKGPWKLDDEHLGEVARIYRESVYLGQPVESVAEYFGVPRPTASRWVAKARDRRLLEPPSKGAKP
jgi:transposase